MVVRWAQGSHPDGLVDAGRRLTSIQTVSFTLLSQAFLHEVQQPWTFSVQRLMEPWEFEHRHKQYLQQVRAYGQTLFWARELLRVVVLLLPFCSRHDMRSFICAAVFARPSAFSLRVQHFRARAT